MCQEYEMIKQALADLAVSDGMTRRPPQKLRTPPPEPKWGGHITPAEKLAQVDEDGRHELLLRELARRSTNLLSSPTLLYFEMMWRKHARSNEVLERWRSRGTLEAAKTLVSLGLAKFKNSRKENYSQLKITDDGWLAIGEKPPVWWQ